MNYFRLINIFYSILFMAHINIFCNLFLYLQVTVSTSGELNIFLNM